MNAIQEIICASIVLAGMASGGPLWAAETERDFALGVNEANAKLRGGDVEGALEQYAEARALAPESADLSYNIAVAQYRKGDVAAAEPLFQAAATSENDSLAAKARYNLGNCDYAAGVELSQKDRLAAIEQLKSAISNYRSSLEVDANNADARANIELAAQLIEKLREEQKQQEQQQNQQQQDQQNQEQKNEQQSENQQQSSEQKNQDQQQNDQEQKSQENQDQQKQDSQSQSSQGGEQKEEQQQQSQENQDQKQSEQSESEKPQQEEEAKQSESQSESQQQQDQAKQQEQESAQQDQPQESTQQPPQNQQSQSSQQRDEQQSKQQQQPQPNQDLSAAEEAEEKKGQQPPQGELTTGNEEEAKQNQDQKPIAAFDPAKDGEMTQQEAEKMLQAIRDRDMLRRYHRQRDELQRHVPVDKDW